MRRIVAATLFALLLSIAFRRDAASQPNLIQEIAPGVYYREAEWEKRIIANTGWIVFRDHVLVIDANFPWGARVILSELRKTTDKPVRYVFNTHYHGDHAFGNSVLVDLGAAVICSEECTEESRRKNPPGWENMVRTTKEHDLSRDRLEHPQISFRDKLVIDDGTRRVELIRVGPGHTRGDAIAWLPKERVLFTGDLAVNRAGNNVADQDADHDNWVRALDSLATMGAATVVPGHGSQGTVETLKGQRAYLKAMIDGVRAGITRGASADQLAQELDLSAHKPWGENPKSNQTSIRAVYAKLKRQ